MKCVRFLKLAQFWGWPEIGTISGRVPLIKILIQFIEKSEILFEPVPKMKFLASLSLKKFYFPNRF